LRLDSGRFLLEYKRNREGRFLQLSPIKQGQKSFIIFPASWNERGWTEIYDALKEISKPHSLRSGVLDTKTSAQRSFPFCNMPPPPPMGCCPRCGFAGEPACFLRTFGQAVSTESLRPTLVEAEGPCSSMAVQTYRGRGEGRLNSSSGGTWVLARRKPPLEGVQGMWDKAGEFTNGSPSVC